MASNPKWHDASEGRWRAHPLASGALRLLIVGVPIAASVLTGAGYVRMAVKPAGGGAQVAWWLGMVVLSTAVLWITDRFTRRLLPLAVLLRMTMAFPDRAPSRYRIARKVSTRDLQKRVDRARRSGIGAEPAKAAETVLALISSLSLHDRRTRGHAERVRVYTDLLAEEYQLTSSQRDRLRWASLLHDIGKLTVPTAILNKPGKPTPAEWTRLRKHPEAGAEFIAPLRKWLGEWARAIPEHHERWDGSGYPAGLAGAEISLGARIVAVADAYEVMTTARPYSKPISPAAARAELTRCAGTQFDPAVVHAFLRISIGRLRWIAGPVSWVLQLPFLPTYHPLIPLNASLPATVAQVGAAGAVAVSPIADLPAHAETAQRAAAEASAAAENPVGDAAPVKPRQSRRDEKGSARDGQRDGKAPDHATGARVDRKREDDRTKGKDNADNASGGRNTGARDNARDHVGATHRADGSATRGDAGDRSGAPPSATVEKAPQGDSVASPPAGNSDTGTAAPPPQPAEATETPSKPAATEPVTTQDAEAASAMAGAKASAQKP